MPRLNQEPQRDTDLRGSLDAFLRQFDGPRIELFSRDLSPMFPKRDGWDVWGNEVNSDVCIAA
jgi:hypothetical protein